ncbi:phosphotransferase [Paenarthrobacter sp. NyZ202]|uniref:phosphotransferase n=1 Tax=Paenarthrobacter sp. NyZ202 TaxID=3402689 RepID=UPI003CE96DBD
MIESISERQHSLLVAWLGSFTVVGDYSWPLQDTTVLHVESMDGRKFIVKASRTSHHIRREIAAYARGMDGLEGKVPTLLFSAPEEGLLVTQYLEGTLVAGSPAESSPDVYRQAGAVLARLHRPAGMSRSYMRSLSARTNALIDKARDVLPQSMVSHLIKEVSAVELYPVALVTSHGDYQPRNWLCDAGEVKVIDFGRADLRPWVHDLVRLSHQQFLTAPDLADAFHEGFGQTMSSPEEHAMWRLENLDQAVGTVVWAHGIGDHGFAQQGVEMVERVLAES